MIHAAVPRTPEEWVQFLIVELQPQAIDDELTLREAITEIRSQAMLEAEAILQSDSDSLIAMLTKLGKCELCRGSGSNPFGTRQLCHRCKGTLFEPEVYEVLARVNKEKKTR